jgi:glycosyltransferase involved in cell wall biosynthesis
MTRLDRQDRGVRIPDDLDAPIIVQSHLRWDFVWQRPQQLLSRLAASNPVLFVEEPIFFDDLAAGRLDLSSPMKNLTRAIPHLPVALREDYDTAVTAVRTLVQKAIGKGGPLDRQFASPIQWFYTPMPAPAMLGAFGERAVVYDCMDELAQFRFAPVDLLDRERLLMENANVVFTGGYKLFQSKSRYHSNVHFFGCGVDSPHFAKARLSDTEIPADVAGITQPIMGYYGVIDERLDYELLAQLAAAHKEWALVMVGPVVKVDPRDLPQGDNIHWLGQKSYNELPAYVKTFDVCLMPFALNEATEYINPTKTLEYMAAGKPIVSTAVADVVRNFTPVVKVARSNDGFVAAVRSAMTLPDASLIARGIGMAKDHSWESIVATMRGLIAESLTSRELTLTVAGDAASDESESWTGERASSRSVATRGRAFDTSAAGGELSA